MEIYQTGLRRFEHDVAGFTHPSADTGLIAVMSKQPSATLAVSHLRRGVQLRQRQDAHAWRRHPPRSRSQLPAACWMRHLEAARSHWPAATGDEQNDQENHVRRVSPVGWRPVSPTVEMQCALCALMKDLIQSDMRSMCTCLRADQKFTGCSSLSHHIA